MSVLQKPKNLYVEDSIEPIQEPTDSKWENDFESMFNPKSEPKVVEITEVVEEPIVEEHTQSSESKTDAFWESLICSGLLFILIFISVLYNQ